LGVSGGGGENWKIENWQQQQQTQYHGTFALCTFVKQY
jgi:hypothetical protein